MKRSHRKKRKAPEPLLADQLGDKDALEAIWALRETALSWALSPRSDGPLSAEDVVRDRLAIAEAAFRIEQNPLWAWLGWRLCRRAGLEVPEWISTYLDRVGDTLEALAVRPPRKPSDAIAQALELKRPGQSGRGTPFSRFQQVDQVLNAIAFQGANDRPQPKIIATARQVARGYATSAALAGPHRDEFARLRAAVTSAPTDAAGKAACQELKVFLRKVASSAPPAGSSAESIYAARRRYGPPSK